MKTGEGGREREDRRKKRGKILRENNTVEKGGRKRKIQVRKIRRRYSRTRKRDR